MTEVAMGDGWGAERERRARRRRWIAFVAVTALSGAAAGVLSVVTGGWTIFGDGLPQSDVSYPHLRIAFGVAFTLLLVAFARWNWVHADEVKRHGIVDFWAAIGFTVLATFPVLHIMAPYFAPGGMLAVLYAAAFCGGMLHYAFRRFVR